MPLSHSLNPKGNTIALSVTTPHLLEKIRKSLTYIALDFLIIQIIILILHVALSRFKTVQKCYFEPTNDNAYYHQI